MADTEEIEGYLIQMGVPYEQIADRTWVIHDEYENIDNIIVSYNEPVVLFHVKLMDIPEECDRQSLYEELLKLNTTDMLAGAYGLDGKSAVVATDTLQSENLDFNEFQASVDALSLCITDHYRKLAKFHKKPVAKAG